MDVDQPSLAVSQRLVHRDWRILIWSLGLVPAISGLTWPRSAFVPDPPWDKWQKFLSENDSFYGHLAGRFCTALTFLSIMFIIVRYWPRNGLYSAGRLVWIGTLAVGASFLVAAILGTEPAFFVGCLGVPLLGTAIYFLPRPDLGWLTQQLSAVCRVYVYGSLLAAVVAFGWTVEYPYELAYFPDFPYRLHGVTINQANLGLLAVFLIFLRLFSPHRTIGVSGVLDIVFSLVVVTAAQSKISLGLAAIFMPWGFIHQFILPIQAISGRLCCAFFVFTVTLVGLAGTLSSNSALEAWREADPNIETLTGRTDIWGISLDLWSQNPLFGYGNALWGNEMSASYATRLGWAPGQAHSQIVQSLAQTGLIGFLLLGFYLVVLFVSSLRGYKITSGLTVVLISALLVRSISESWIRSFITDGNFLAHMMALALVITALRTIEPPATSFDEPPPLS